MDALFFVSANGLVIGISILATVRFWPGAPRAHRWLVAWSVGGILIELTVLGLGLAGRLTPLAALVLLVVLASVVLLLLRLPPRTGPDSPQGSPRGWDMAAWALLTAALVPPILRLVTSGPGLGWDDYSYHAAFPARWLIEATIDLAPFNYHAYYPFNSELLSLWFMLPFRSDALVGLSGTYWLILLALGCYAVLRNAGARPRISALGAALALASPVVVSSASRFAASDLAGPAALLAAIALLVRTTHPGRLAGEPGDLLLGGMMAGLAAGTKAFFIPGAAVLAIWIVIAWGTGLRNRVTSMALFSAASLVTGSYWYLRNMVVTGNPLFPAEVGPFDGPFTVEHQWQTRLIRWFVEHPLDLGVWREGLLGLSDWPLILGLLATAGFVMGLVALVSRRDLARTVMTPLLAIAAVLAVAALYVPFSGTFNSPDAPFAPEPRFLTVTFIAGLLAFCRMLPDRARPSPLEFLAMAILAVVLLQERPVVAPAAGVAAVLALTAIRRTSLRVRSIITHPGTGLAVAVLSLAGLGVWHPVVESKIADQVFSYRRGHVPIGNAWSYLENLRPGTRIAGLGLARDQLYPLFGRDLDFFPVAIAPSGRVLEPLHVLWRSDQQSVRWWGGTEEPDSAALVRSLRDQRIEAVLVATEEDPAGSPFRRIVSSLEGVALLYDDPYLSIWRLNE